MLGALGGREWSKPLIQERLSRSGRTNISTLRMHRVIIFRKSPEKFEKYTVGVELVIIKVVRVVLTS